MNNVSKIFGIRAVIEAIKSEKTLDKVFVQKGLRGELFQQLDQLLRQNSVNVSYVPIEKLNRLTKKNHQGVVAHISPIEYHELDNLIMNVFESGETPSLFKKSPMEDHSPTAIKSSQPSLLKSV